MAEIIPFPRRQKLPDYQWFDPWEVLGSPPPPTPWLQRLKDLTATESRKDDE